MMDVISARRESDDTEYQLNAIQQRIETILHTPVSASYTDSLPPPTDPWGLIRNDLFLIERNILIGDWGGYRQEYRRPFLERVDRLRTMMGETPPVRPEHVYTQTQRQYYQREFNASHNVHMIPSPVMQQLIHERHVKQQHERQQQRRQQQQQQTTTSTPVVSLPLFHDINDTIKKKYTQETCSICLVAFTLHDNTLPTYLGCKHRFHTVCIKTWIQNNDTCPVCKHNIYILA